MEFMDAPIVDHVTAMVRQRGGGKISSAEFVDFLSELQLGDDFEGLLGSGPSALAERPTALSALGPDAFSFPSVLSECEADELLRRASVPRQHPGVAAVTPAQRPATIEAPALLTHEQATALAQQELFGDELGEYEDEINEDAAGARLSPRGRLGAEPGVYPPRIVNSLPSSYPSSHDGSFSAYDSRLREFEWMQRAQEEGCDFSTTPLQKCRGVAAQLQEPGHTWAMPAVNPMEADVFLRDASACACTPIEVERSLGSRSHASEHDSVSASSFSTFSRRSEIWERRRLQKQEDLRRQRDMREVAECTFAPAVRGGSRAADRSLQNPNVAEAVSARLAGTAGQKPQRSEVDQWLKQREEEVMRECSFIPDVSKSSCSFRKNGGQEPLDSASRLHRTVISEDFAREEDSFVPRTNEVPSHMLHAQTYLQKNVFDRLTNPQPDLPWDQPEHLPAGDREDGSLAASSCLRLSSSEASSAADTFLDFLRRQNHFEEERCLRLMELEAATAPPHHPELCDRSRRLVERRGDPTLSQERRSHSPAPAECSFRPEINRSSALLASRSCAELSSGDLVRRDARMAELRDQHRQQPEGTFQPQLHPAPAHLRGTKGRARALAHEDSKDCARRTVTAQLKAERREREARRKDDLDAAECSFQPRAPNGRKPGDCPAFVRSMAESHRVVRSLREKENLAEGAASLQQRPGWV